MEYGVAVNNKYELFLEECDDPLEILQRKEEEAAKLKVDKNNAKNAPTKKSGGKPTAGTTTAAGKTAGKPTKQPASVLTESKSNKIANQDPSGPRKENTERPPRFGGSRQNENVNRPPRQQFGGGEFGGEKRENVPRPEFSREAGDRENIRGRGGFRRGRGGPGRGRGGEAGFDRFGKREFDRHSGTGQGGVKATDKREGGGAHNWGNIKDDIEDQLKPMDVTVEQTAEGEPASVEGGSVAVEAQQEGTAPEGENTAAELEEETKQMTLDEWKRMEEQRKMKSEFNIRQAGEGYKVDPKWKKMYQLKKKKDESEEEEEEEEDDENDEEMHGRQKHTVNIPITFNDSGRRGGPAGGRGGRGGPRGGRGAPRGGRGGDRPSPSGGNKGDIAPNVADEMDFPSLS